MAIDTHLNMLLRTYDLPVTFTLNGQALQNASADMDADAGLIPAVYVEAPSSGESDFS